MNPPTPFFGAPSSSSSSSFTFLPSYPNPNPNPNLSYFNYQNRPSSTTNNYNPITSPPPPPPPPPDLPTALSTLKDLIRLSETTLDSISTLLRTTTAGATATATATVAPDNVLCPCSFNPHHRVPPDSLFHHSLSCPSSPARVLNLDLLRLESLRYPNTGQSADELIKQNCFVQTVHDLNADHCFSLDEYCDFGSNFFYRDCPGVGSSTDQDSTSRTFTLPGILSVECANFTRSGNNEIKGFSGEHIGLLPSELWFVRTEIEAWNYFPTTYSYSVLRAILCSPFVQQYDFLRWIIVNSPHYGVVIDVPMRDHMVLLFRLCLKSIVNEAVVSADLVFLKGPKELNPFTMSFKCPILVEVLKWLSFQFSVLYGAVNGKLFAINMLKRWIINASLNSSLFRAVQEAPKSPDLRDADGNSVETFEKSVEDGHSVLNESINSRVIFVSQVAAAVAALHERSLLEEKIKALRDARPLTNYQRIAEHAHISKRADEERKKRSNYRPLIEHDGLLWQRTRDQESNKTKTREELLAEERDYKRRRMSYRGKKLKRSTTQVMRDIIEEYMEDITQAGGVGCLAKGAEEAGTFSCEPSPFHDISTDVEGVKRDVRDSSEVSRDQPHAYKKQLYSHNNIRVTRFEDESPEYRKQHRRDASWQHIEARRSVDRGRRDREYYSRSPDRERSNGRSSDQVSNHGHRDDVELSRKNFPQSADYSHSRSHERTHHKRERGDWNSEMRNRRQRHSYRDHRSHFVPLHEFEDRYDPSESRNMYEDDVSSGTGILDQINQSQK